MYIFLKKYTNYEKMYIFFEFNFLGITFKSKIWFNLANTISPDIYLIILRSLLKKCSASQLCKIPTFKFSKFLTQLGDRGLQSTYMFPRSLAEGVSPNLMGCRLNSGGCPPSSGGSNLNLRVVLSCSYHHFLLSDLFLV